MASEKDRWWCPNCNKEIKEEHMILSLIGTFLHYHQGLPHYCDHIPAAALDAHTAEVVEKIAQHFKTKAIAADDREASGWLWWIADEIRALAPRKEG